MKGRNDRFGAGVRCRGDLDAIGTVQATITTRRGRTTTSAAWVIG
jgi:hypothetical protein